VTYEEALAAIAALEPRGWKLGLERMTEFVRRAGLESTVRGGTPKYLHVAGTNGKGSVTAYLQSILIAAGLRTGGFFSPYVYDPRERVQLQGELIDKARFAQFAEDLFVCANAFDDSEFGGISEFEFKTALAFRAFQNSGVEWVALETGLGGRLDSTNVVDPVVSVIVSIGLDHQAILGDTVAQIAFEKAGIIKPGRPVVVGQMPESARDTILNVAEKRGSPVWRFGEEIRLEGDAVITPEGGVAGLEPALTGVWQRHNLALAVAALQLAKAPVSPEAMRQGARTARLPGRFQRVESEGKLWLLDGAHNADSGEALAETLSTEYQGQSFWLVTNMLAGHNLEPFYRPLVPLISSAGVVPIDVPRSRPVEETTLALRRLGISANPHPTVEAGLAKAKVQNLPVLVTGSFYLVGEVGRALGL
jgi:dihydrofolate synthase/folylpolyglutamate synthase